jgi:hypothetical protein
LPHPLRGLIRQTHKVLGLQQARDQNVFVDGFPVNANLSADSSHAILCFVVAARSLGNQASGTETVRPSARTTFSSSALHETSTAVTSLLSTKVVMPFLQKELFILYDDLSNLSELVGAKAMITR